MDKIEEQIKTIIMFKGNINFHHSYKTPLPIHSKSGNNRFYCKDECQCCSKKIDAVHDKRTNGKKIKKNLILEDGTLKTEIIKLTDWEYRYLHKTCYSVLAYFMAVYFQDLVPPSTKIHYGAKIYEDRYTSKNRFDFFKCNIEHFRSYQQMIYLAKRELAEKNKNKNIKGVYNFYHFTLQFIVERNIKYKGVPPPTFQ